MVTFDDKDIVEDPLDELDSVHAPNAEREGPVVQTLNALMRKRSGGSYHNTDPNRGHLSSSDGCKRRNYLNYIHKLDDDLEVPPNDMNSEWTFKHGDAVHELIQELLVEELGHEHVTIEETVSYDLGGDYYIYGHADVVIRGLDSAEPIEEALPGDVDLLPDDFKGFPDPFVIDIKTKSEFTYYNYGKGGHARTVPKDGNLMQLNGYMGILEAQLGCLLYFSKRNDHLEEYWIEFDEDLFQQAKQNIGAVLDAVNTGQPAPRDASGAYMCEKFCKWHDQGKCPGIDEAETPDSYDGDDSPICYDSPDWEE
jgi:hypothetical protein